MRRRWRKVVFLGLVGRGGAACVGSSEAGIGWIDGISSTEAGRKVAGRGRPVDSGTGWEQTERGRVVTLAESQ